MFNKTLYFQLTKSNFKLFAIITFVLCLLITIIMSVFDPETMKTIAKASEDAPIQPLGDISTLISFVSNQYFGMISLILVMIYSIIVGNKLVADKVDKGSMAYDLSTPTTRTEITVTSAIYLISSLVVMFGLIFGIGYAVAEIVQPGELPIGTFFTLTFGAFLLHIAVSSIAFLSSCFFNRSSTSLAFGAGIPVFFFAANLLSGMSESLHFLKYVTLITLFNPDKIILGVTYVGNFIVLAVIGSMLYFLGIVAFKRKDLPL
jgi:ABC-2 type transport system permease protein